MECPWCTTDVESFYAMCEEYWRERNDLMNNLMFYSHVHKALAHGRVIVFRGDRVNDEFEHAPRRQQVGVILNAFGEAADRYTPILIPMMLFHSTAVHQRSFFYEFLVWLLNLFP